MSPLPPIPFERRPVPIQDAFAHVTSAVKFLASVVSILAGYGLFSVVQESAWLALLGAVPGLVTLAGDVVRSMQVDRAIVEAEAAVTPLSDPAIVVNGELVPLVPDAGRHRLAEG